MKTRDSPLFVGIVPATLLGGLCLAALTTQAQIATWTGGAGTGSWNTAGWELHPNFQFIL